MSELISGKEALNNWYDDIDTEIQFLGNIKWYNISDSDVTLEDFKDSGNKFRLKPKTITLSGIEVPAPFEPKEGDIFYILSTGYECGYVKILYYRNDKQGNMLAQFGAWRTEDEIKQVVAALRKIFVINNQ